MRVLNKKVGVHGDFNLSLQEYCIIIVALSLNKAPIVIQIDCSTMTMQNKKKRPSCALRSVCPL